MNAATREKVRQRANNQCEYCQLSQAQAPFPLFHIEHIQPRKHGGGDDDQNLCLACNHCNLHKSSNLTGIDPESGSVVRLYHPRRDHWDDHFAFHVATVVGRTPIGRATVRVLNMNAPERIELRQELGSFRTSGSEP